jgi:hypothetical protein
MDAKIDPALHRYMQGLLENRHTVWESFYASGGYAMYPTTVFGFLLVLAACGYAFQPEKRFIPVVVAAGILTIASGMCGTFMGLMTVFTYVQSVEPALAAKAATVGSARVFANALFAFALVLAAGLAMLAGALRQALRRVA